MYWNTGTSQRMHYAELQIIQFHNSDFTAKMEILQPRWSFKLTSVVYIYAWTDHFWKEMTLTESKKGSPFSLQSSSPYLFDSRPTGLWGIF